MKIAIAGGTGFVGQRLAKLLAQAGHTVVVLTRNPATASIGSTEHLALMGYDPVNVESWQVALADCDGVVNLVGEPLTESRWSDRQKDEILRSRTRTTSAMVKAIAALETKPSVVVSASAVGYYGPHQDEELDEFATPADDFLARVCKEWEAAAKPLESLGVRLVQIRIGIVLGKGGGALGKMLGPFQMFVGGPIGSGKQWLSWIHRDDLAGLIIYALTTDSVSGVLNGTAPNPVKMSEFSDTLGKVLARPSWLPVPPIALEIILGESAQVVLTGQRVLPKRTLEQGYTFTYPQLESALREILVES
ncbi:MAG: TIGR01777 family oxidoreductase [Cyanobacteria bacterium P01_E01_bin.34]